MTQDELVRCGRAIVSGELREDYAFLVRDGVINAAGDYREVRQGSQSVTERSFPADRLVVPGFINGHSHAYQILLRGWADDWPFAKWRSDALYRVVPQLTPDDVYWTFVAAFSEMLAAGITTVAEFFTSTAPATRTRKPQSAQPTTRASASCSHGRGWTPITHLRSFAKAPKLPPNGRAS